MMRNLIIFLLLSAALPVSAKPPERIAGTYDAGLFLTYDSTSKLVSGYFNESLGGGPFSCVFYLTGTLNEDGDRATIKSFYPAKISQEPIEGTISFSAKGKIDIQLKEEHGGCANVRPFADPANLASFNLSVSHPKWKRIEIIKTSKAYFYSHPQETARLKTYLIERDAVAVLRESGQWQYVEYVQGNHLTRGYLKKSDLLGLSLKK